jgi:hypothetical protein
MNPGVFLAGPDYVSAWIRVDRLIHRIVGQRLNQGSTPELDAQFDNSSSCTGGWRSGWGTDETPSEDAYDCANPRNTAARSAPPGNTSVCVTSAIQDRPMPSAELRERPHRAPCRGTSERSFTVRMSAYPTTRPRCQRPRAHHPPRPPVGFQRLR